MSSLEDILRDALHAGAFRRAVLSRRRSTAESPCETVRVRVVQVKGAPVCQLSMRSGKRETHENLSADAAARRIVRWCRTDFHDCHLFTDDADYSIRIADDGTEHIKRKAVGRPQTVETHDRKKAYLIPEGVPCDFLVETGVMTAEGKVRAAKYRKFRQVNRFLELVNDVVSALPAEGPLHVVDFGCGKSYLTFALHHLLATVHHRDVQLVGLDREEGVVRQCRALAGKLQCPGLSFRRQDICEFEGFRPNPRVDLVVSLHACDIATDDALAQAVRWRAGVILAVPCCQHEVASAMTGESVSGLARHGILKERFAALATDALRAAVLERHGYRTQVVEFIDMEHTAKNVLLRSLRRPGGRPASHRVDEIRQLKDLLGIERFRLEDDLST
ncbi:MAG: SAM-dependent methyltransferase [Planctomycetaceae bacterium]